MFNIGDRVVVRAHYLKGPKKGTIIGRNVLYKNYFGIEFDKPIPNGHSCDFHMDHEAGKEGHCWFVNIKDIEFVNGNNEVKHRKMWRWLANHPTKTKMDYFKKFGIKRCDMPAFSCYACEEAGQNKMITILISRFLCKTHCPFKYLVNSVTSECLGGLYHEWFCETSILKRSILARRISRLKWEYTTKNEEENSYE